MSDPLRIAIGIATMGRPALAARTIMELRRQTRAPDEIVVCGASPADVAGLGDVAPKVRCILSDPGLPLQRNAILRDVGAFDVVIFLDDDFLAAPDYVRATEAAFLSEPAVVMTTGQLIADGICGPGFQFGEARAILGAGELDRGDEPVIGDVYNGYGCNMAIRIEPVRTNGLLFDEALPLYAWLEDVDFSRRLAAHGRIVRVSAARGVHLGIKSGRQTGLRLGYSQIANPIYLVRKGTYSWRRAAYMISRNLLANAVRTLRPEPNIDRQGRALGNGRALLDLVTGRLAPARILSL